MKLVLITAAAGLLFIAGCHAAAGNGETTDSTERGEDLYPSKCGGCHRLYAPGDFSSTQWDSILPRMKQKAALSDVHFNLIQAYLKDKSKVRP